MKDDTLVSAIFDTMRSAKVSASERKRASIRAGLIAQSYAYADEKLIEEVFGSFPDDSFKNDKKLVGIAAGGH